MDIKSDLPARLGLNVPWAAEIATTPTDESDTLMVVIPDFHPRYQWGPCYWQHRGGVSLPTRGDKCLVIFDNNRRPWVVSWWPF